MHQCIRPLIGAFAPGHHGYQRACVLISGQASTGPFGSPVFACAGNELSVRYGLGLDPFDPRDNILAGTAYLKEMFDRFGSAGFLAAYHTGPSRFEQHLATGRPLPTDTVAYVTAVTPLLGNGQGEHAAFRIKRAVPWREAPLFVERVDAR